MHNAVYIFNTMRENVSTLLKTGFVQKKRLFDAVSEAGIKSFVVDDFDVRIINNVPCYIVIDILREGILLADNNLDLRGDYIERISNEYRVNYFILDEAYGEDR